MLNSNRFDLSSLQRYCYRCILDDLDLFSWNRMSISSIFNNQPLYFCIHRLQIPLFWRFCCNFFWSSCCTLLCNWFLQFSLFLMFLSYFCWTLTQIFALFLLIGQIEIYGVWGFLNFFLDGYSFWNSLSKKLITFLA